LTGTGILIFDVGDQADDESGRILGSRRLRKVVTQNAMKSGETYQLEETLEMDVENRELPICQLDYEVNPLKIARININCTA
jgi:hypothetical protein